MSVTVSRSKFASHASCDDGSYVIDERGPKGLWEPPRAVYYVYYDLLHPYYTPCSNESPGRSCHTVGYYTYYAFFHIGPIEKVP